MMEAEIEVLHLQATDCQRLPAKYKQLRRGKEGPVHWKNNQTNKTKQDIYWSFLPNFQGIDNFCQIQIVPENRKGEKTVDYFIRLVSC